VPIYKTKAMVCAIIMDTIHSTDISIEDLKEKREYSLALSEQAILKKPACYQQIKKLLNHIISSDIDIDQYHKLADKLSRCLIQMGTNTIFHTYFYENINPLGPGSVFFFRSLCKDLLDQIDQLNHWRAQKRNICVIE